MSISRPIAEQSYPYRFIDDSFDPNFPEKGGSLQLARKHLLSIKKEVDCGTPVDPKMILEMEAAIDRLEHLPVTEEE